LLKFVELEKVFPPSELYAKWIFLGDVPSDQAAYTKFPTEAIAGVSEAITELLTLT
jgi:hypothetical protein